LTQNGVNRLYEVISKNVFELSISSTSTTVTTKDKDKAGDGYVRDFLY
jgi:hypothetical protein